MVDGVSVGQCCRVVLERKVQLFNAQDPGSSVEIVPHFCVGYPVRIKKILFNAPLPHIFVGRLITTTSASSAMLRALSFAAVIGATYGFVTPHVVRPAIPAEVWMHDHVGNAHLCANARTCAVAPRCW